MRNFICILVLFIVSSDVFAQNNSSKTEKIVMMMNLTGSGNIGVTVANNMIESFKKSLPDVPDEFWNEFKNELKADELVKLVIPIYDKYYTESEIDELIKFYNTPVGKKMISNLPSIMQESMEVGRTWGKIIGEKAIVKLKEKGIIKN